MKVNNKKSSLVLLFLIFISVVISMPVKAGAGPLDTWTSVGNSVYLYGAAYGEGTAVALRSNSYSYSSTDYGATWANHPPGGTGYILYGVTYANGNFIAVGQEGTINTSSDGITWTPKTSGSSSTLYEAAFGNGTYVVVGGSGTILSSTDTVTWTSRTSGTGYNLWGVTYGNGVYVAVGYGGTILTSTNVTTWTARTSGTTNGLEYVTYGNGTYVAVGAAGTILTSTDAITWTLRTSGTSNALRSVAYGNGSFVVVGDGGTLLTSTNATAWTAKASGTSANLNGVVYADSVFIVCGGSIILVSGSVTTTEAADNTSLTLTTGGNAKWFGQNAVTFNGGDALQSGLIDHSQSSWMEASVTGPLYLTFMWKVSSEANYDYLRFYVDGTEQPGKISGEKITSITRSGTTATATVSGVDTTAWSVGDTIVISGAGQAEYNGTFTITSIPTSATFTYTVSGTPVTPATGTITYWQQKAFNIASGAHTVKWEYKKDGSVSTGSDAGWVDKICTYYVSTGDYNLNTAGSQLFTSSGGSNSHILVDAPAGCAWTAVSNDSWITINSSNSGYGAVTYSVSANATVSARTGTITVAGQTFTVTQGGSVTLGSALGNTALTDNTAPFSGFTNSGNASWAGQNAAPYDTQNAAQSGDILDSQSSYFQTTVTGPLTISYYWKVSSEGSYDFLKFYDGATTVYSTSGDYDWVQKTYSVPSGSHTLKWEYSKESDFSKRNDSGWVNRVCTFAIGSTSPTFTSAASDPATVAVTVTGSSCSWTATTSDNWITISSGSGTGSGTVTYSVSANTGASQRTGTITIMGQTFTVTQKGVIAVNTALDNTSLTWTTGGDANWYGQNLTTHDGSDALQSGNIGDSQQSWMQTTVTGPLTVSFWWNVSSDGTPMYSNDYDKLYFYVDGSEQAGIGGTETAQGAGNVGWEQKAYAISAGTHTLKWSYTKDSIETWGSDAGWVDQVCTYSISSPSASYKSSGGTGSFDITTTPATGCLWTATVTNSEADVAAITASGNYTGSGASASGSGSKTLNYSVASHVNGYTRSATITIYAQGTATNGQVFTINEGANIPTLSLAPLSPVSLGAVKADNVATKTQEFTIKNTGSGTLNVGAINTQGSAVFTVATGGSSPCSNLTPSLVDGGIDTCTVVVTFRTNSAGLNTGTLRVTSNHLNGTNVNTDITLNGYGDSTAPTTTASVPGGIYNAQPTVTLMCSDNSGGSGCAYLAYTTNGNDPPTYLADPAAYSAYSVPVTLPTIAATTTLKFRSVDGVGNLENINSVTYTIDSTPPSAGDISVVSILPKTGQTSCYDASGVLLGACTSTGQDGDTKANGKDWPASRFVIGYRDVNGPCADQSADCDADASNDVMVDKLTGFMWPRLGNTPGVGVCGNGVRSWTNALSSYIDCLNGDNYLGYHDWRMPNKNELASLVNLESSNPSAWLNNQGYSNVQATYYWSSTNDTNNGWVVDMATGKIIAEAKGSNYYILPVRDSSSESAVLLAKTGQATSVSLSDDGDLKSGETWPNPRFKSNGDSTVTDALTGLVWVREGNTPTVSGCTGGTRTWAQAITYVSCLNGLNAGAGYLGFNDWRLPNRNEITSLINAGQSNTALWLNADKFSNLQAAYYWTSTNSMSAATKAWMVKLDTGEVNHNVKTTAYYVLPVRSGKLSSTLIGGGILAGFGASKTKSSDVVLTLSASDANAVTEMKLSNNGTDWTDALPYSTNLTWSLSSGDGDKTVYVKFKDFAGSWSTGTISDAITVDTTAPVTTAVPAGGIYSSAQTVALAADESSTIYYTVNDTAPTTSSSVYSGVIAISGLTNGKLRFFAVDSLGNAEAPKTETYTVDSAGPNTGVAPSGGSFKNPPTVTLACDDSLTGGSGCAGIYYTTDGNDPDTSNAAQLYAAPIVINSTTTLKYRSKDNAGNSGGVTTATYVIDTVPPGISIGNPSASLTRTASVTYTVTYTGADAVTLANSDITLDATGTANGTVQVSGSGTATRTVTISGITGDGTLGIGVLPSTASDNAGNLAGPAGPATAFTVDNTAPAVSISGPSASIARGGPITYTVTYENADTVTLADANVTLNKTGTANGTVHVSGSGGLSRTVTISGITGDGSLGISLASGSAGDTAGNSAAAAGPAATFAVDNTLPSTAASPAGGAFKAAQAVILICSDGSGSGCAGIYYTTDGSDPDTSNAGQLYNAPVQISSSATLKYRSKDNAGGIEAVQSKSVVIDGTVPSATITAPADGSMYKSLAIVNGTVSDTGGSGISKVEVQITDGTLYLNSSKEFDVTPDVWVTVSNVSGSGWSFPTSAINWASNTTYTVRARATDVAGNVSSTVTSSFTKAPDINMGSTLSLDLSSQTILKEGTINVSGKITSLPDIGGGLKSIPVTITVTAPDSSAVVLGLSTYDIYGHFKYDNLSGFSQKGTYTIKASVAATAIMSGSSSEKTVLVGAAAGYAILVQGKIPNQEGLASHNKTANRIYKKLRDRGFRDQDINYFNYDTSQSGVDAAPDKTAIRNAVTSWAKDLMNGFPAPLYIIMVNHGDPNVFHINNETISPADLASWLNTLEGGLNTAALAEKRFVIIGSCFSGSFIPVVAKEGRIVITSAAADEESYKGPREDDNIRSGEFFLEEFFKQLSDGYSFKKSFELATGKTESFTKRGGSSANSAGKYFDSAMQHPLLNDSGNGNGSNSLSDGSDDGKIVSNLFFGTGTNNLTNSAGSGITSVTETKYLSASESATVLWLTVSKNNEVGSAWAEIRKPSTVLTSGSSSLQVEIDMPKVVMTFNEGSNRWETTASAFASAGVAFSDAGMYEIYYYTKDNTEKQEISPMKRSVVYKNKAGNTAPAAFDLVSPVNANQEKTVLVFDWSDSADADGLTYNLVIASDINFTEIAYKKEEITDSMTFVDMTAGLNDLTTYYWRVEAVDIYGAKTASTQTWSFSTNNTNGYPGIVTGLVYGELDNMKINDASIDVGGVKATVKNGMYIITTNAGTFTISAKDMPGYSNAALNGVNVIAGETTVVNLRMSRIDTAAPATTASPAGGTYTQAQSVTLAANETATIYYTTDGSAPTTASPVYSGAITISGATVLKFFSVDAKGNAESVKTETYTITDGSQADTTAPTTTASPAGNSYDTTQTVALTCNDGAGGSGCSIIYYSTDGSNPTTVYAGPVTISSDTTLMFYSVDSKGNYEGIKTETYTIGVPDTASPVTVASVSGGTYTSARTVTLSCDDGADGSGCAATYYSVDGSDPATEYSGAITISEDATLKFYSVDNSGNKETVSEEAYKIVALTSKQASLTVSKSGTGSGTVTSSPSGITCGVDCIETAGVFAKGKITLTATADADSTFTGWTGGGCKSAAKCIVTLSKETKVTANFVAKPVLKVTKVGSGSGTIKGGPSSSCETEAGCAVNYNQKITLTATAAKGSVFTGWSGGICKGTAKCSLTMSADKEVTASFGKPDISVSPESYAFDSLSIKAKTPLSATFTITNSGDADLKITKMAISSTAKGDAAMFKVTGKTVATVKAGATFNVIVTFKPKSTGDKSATLKITSNDIANSPLSIALTGTGASATKAQTRGLSLFTDTTPCFPLNKGGIEGGCKGTVPGATTELWFNPEGLVTREEMAEMIKIALSSQQSAVSKDQTTINSQLSAFSSQLPDNYVTWREAQELVGVIYAVDNPEEYVTREEMAFMAVNSQLPASDEELSDDCCKGGSPFVDVAPDRWSCRYIKKLYELIGQ